MTRKNKKRRFSDFWECMTVTETGCWEWQGCRDRAGYGEMRIEGKHYKTHRRAFELTCGYLPEVVMHTCDNPPCCNPAHLRGGTHADNTADKIAKGRGRTNPRKGEICNFAKLTSDTVKQIRLRYATESISQSQLAREYGVTQSAIWCIVRNKKWKHLTDSHTIETACELLMRAA